MHNILELKELERGWGSWKLHLVFSLSIQILDPPHSFNLTDFSQIPFGHHFISIWFSLK